MDSYRKGYLLTAEPSRATSIGFMQLSHGSYWAKGRPRAVTERSIAGSRPYSVYAQEEQTGFARVVTDGATFAWICDVFVDEHHRRRRLGTWPVESIVENLGVPGVQRLHLATRDALEVYRRCGFSAMKGADRWMEIDLRPTRAAVLGVDPAPMPTRDQP